MNRVISIFSSTRSEYCAKVHLFLGKGAWHAERLYSDFFQKGIMDPCAPWVELQARSLVKEIIALTDFSTFSLSDQKEEGSTFKFLLKYADGLEVESVLIPMGFGNTQCISSQVGCRMGCAFCETGKMGLVRQLKAEEIVLQVFVAKFLLRANIRNIVFMGMGEPFDNYEEVMQAIRVLTCESGLGIGASRITVSTSGRVPEIYRFIQEANPAVNLAVSLNAFNDKVRSKLMPVNNQWNLNELKDAMLAYCNHPRRQILVEYVLIEGVNDSLEAALDVANYLKGLKVKVNLIPYNAQSSGRFKPPREEKMREFQNYLKSLGYRTLLRTSKGRSIMAACGQLGNRDLKKKLSAKSSLSLLCEVEEPLAP